MAHTQALIAQLYAAFNQRDIEGALALMSESVSWPKASEGGRVVGIVACRREAETAALAHDLNRSPG